MQKQTTALDAFLGIWSVRRTILDYRAGSVFRFEGRAVLTDISFEERGQMAHGGGMVPAARSYRLRSGGNSLAILFADGREFIELEPRASQIVHHQCGDDAYFGRFFFRDDDAWAERWRVEGPRKRYASLACYRRPSAFGINQ